MLWRTLAHVSCHVEPCKSSLAPQWLAMASLWCHTGAMDLGTYVSNIRQELALAADAGGDDARALAERLAAPLESALRLALLDALSDAAVVITRVLSLWT